MSGQLPGPRFESCVSLRAVRPKNHRRTEKGGMAMNYPKLFIGCSVALLISTGPASSFSTHAADAPVYKPPTRGAPGGRVGGGTRGNQSNVFILSVLAPDQGGFTTSEQPCLYWYISSATTLPVEVTVMDAQGVQPLLETRLTSPVKAGVQRVSLTDYNVRLAPGTAYRWFVAVVPDNDRRSKDILAGGAVEQIEPTEDLKAKLAQASKQEKAFIYADAGIWYDALREISDMIEAAPHDQKLIKERAELLRQVGLSTGDE
jgi:Domain of Unknown Function (DUF928)